MSRKTVYWAIRDKRVEGWTIDFWTEPEKEDRKTEEFAMFDEERLRYRVEVMSGLRGFELIQVDSDAIAGVKTKKRKGNV